MKNAKLHFATLFLFGALCIILLWLIAPYTRKTSPPHSPIPGFLTLYDNQQTATLDLWLPSLFNQFSNKVEVPEITAKSALLFDIDKNTALFEKHPQERLPMASSAKVMTAIVGLEHNKAAQTYTVHSSDLVGEDVMGLEKGEVLSLDELLYGLILHSGNDAAEVIASNFPGGRDAFIKAMNDKVLSLGLSSSHFTNPTGLERDGDQYTTAYDLMVITRYALLHFPLFGSIVETFDYTIPQTSNHKAFYLENETNLLTSYPGVKGVKTGYTPEALLCLITYLDYKGHHFIGVLLGSGDRRDEMKELLDFGLKTEGITPPPHG